MKADATEHRAAIEAVRDFCEQEYRKIDDLLYVDECGIGRAENLRGQRAAYCRVYAECQVQLRTLDGETHDDRLRKVGLL